MQRIEAVITDLDGTAVLPDATVTPGVKAVMADLRANAVVAAPVTGRDLHGSSQMIEPLGFQDLGVFSRGASIADMKQKTVIWEQRISQPTTYQVVGGHTDRRAAVPDDQLISPENAYNIDPIASRIENSINGMINIWFRSPEHIRMGLAFTFPSSVEGTEVFHLENLNGTHTFSFTEHGREWLCQRLTGSNQKISESYGARIFRQLYAASASRPPRYVGFALQP